MYNYFNKIKYNKGFTMVETLIAIAILMISVAGPLTIAQKGLNAAIYARDQSVASFLAQDAMEYIKNSRDVYMRLSTFDAWYPAKFGACIGANAKCSIDTTLPQSSSQTLSTTDFLLYHDGAGYHHGGTIPSQFSRYFNIEFINTSEVKVSVTVSWSNGPLSNSILLEDYLFDVTL